MRADYKKGWQASEQPRKQRKFRANAPLHVKGRFLNASLSKELRSSQGRRTLRVRKGDEIEVMRGEHKGKRGVVESVNTKSFRLYVRGVEHLKRDGSKSPMPIAASNVRIVKLVEDKRRI
jgi:large subunit ribosomal protein L24